MQNPAILYELVTHARGDRSLPPRMTRPRGVHAPLRERLGRSVVRVGLRLAAPPKRCGSVRSAKNLTGPRSLTRYANCGQCLLSHSSTNSGGGGSPIQPDAVDPQIDARSRTHAYGCS